MDELKRQNPPEQPLEWDDADAIAVGIEGGVPVYQPNPKAKAPPPPWPVNRPTCKGAGPVIHRGPNRKQRRAMAKRRPEPVTAVKS